MPLEKLSRELRDKIAVSLSMLCVLQCLFLPIVVSVLPILDIWWLKDSFMHPFMLFLIIPLTLVTLLPGYRQHKNLQPLLIAVPSIMLLIAGAFIPESFSEKLLTVAGALILASAHIRNMILCRKS